MYQSTLFMNARIYNEALSISTRTQNRYEQEKLVFN